MCVRNILPNTPGARCVDCVMWPDRDTTRCRIAMVNVHVARRSPLPRHYSAIRECVCAATCNSDALVCDCMCKEVHPCSSNERVTFYLVVLTL